MAVIDEQTPAVTGWLTTSQASRRLEWSASYIRLLVARGRLRSVPTALGTLIDPDSVDELIRARETDSRGEKEPA